jgi:hypothetical protein
MSSPARAEPDRTPTIRRFDVYRDVNLDRSVRRAGIAHEPAALFFKTTAVEISDANCRPAELGHNLRKVPVSTRRTLALRDLSDVHQRLWEIRSGPHTDASRRTVRCIRHRRAVESATRFRVPIVAASGLSYVATFGVFTLPE